jgi:hypothetical protein
VSITLNLQNIMASNGSLETFSADLASALPSSDKPLKSKCKALLEAIHAPLEKGLPFCGFDGSYEDACRNPASDPRADNEFLWRVWHENSNVVTLQPKLGFVAPAFSADSRQLSISELEERIHEGRVESNYERRSLIMDRVLNRGPSSPIIPTTLSFYWAYWWASRVAATSRYDAAAIHISMIRARYLEPDSVWMPHEYCTGRDEDCTKARNFSNTSQGVLVFGRIPEFAVVATLTLARLQFGDLVFIPVWMRDSPPASVRWPTSFRSYTDHWATMLQSQSPENHLSSAVLLSYFIMLECRRGTACIEDNVALCLHLIARPYGARPPITALEMIKQYRDLVVGFSIFYQS